MVTHHVIEPFNVSHLDGVLDRDAWDGVGASDGVREREAAEGGGAPEGPGGRLANDAAHAPGRAEGGLQHGAVGGDGVPLAADAGRPRDVRGREPVQDRPQEVGREVLRVHRGRIGRCGGVGGGEAEVGGGAVHGDRGGGGAREACGGAGGGG